VNISGGLTEEALVGVMREAMIRCRDHWIAEGVDLSAYNVDSIARDTDDLRAALGYDTVSLYGGSFGSHLGLHYIRLFPERVHRAVFAGIEGPDDTYDAPSEYLATLERIARHAEASAELGDSLPDVGLIEALKQTVERLREQPEVVMMGDSEVIVTEAVIRAFGDFRAGDRGQPTFWPMLIAGWYEGDLTMAARAGGSLRSLPPIDAMKFVVDATSGGSPERMARLETDEGAGLFLREAMERKAGAGVWPTADLGPGFWEPVTADTTVLLVHGQWDTSTPIENARRAAAALPNAHLIEVVHGRHGAMNDLYNHWPAVHEKLESFLRGEPTEFPEAFTIPPVDYGEGG
jgi:pimeloyl-ACP methyl ester carboxylesterase